MHARYIDCNNRDIFILYTIVTIIYIQFLIRYHFIGKLEHIGADSALLLSSLKAPEHLSYPPVEKSKTSHVYDSYMDQLSTALRQELKNVYREDFEIFGYEERNAV